MKTLALATMAALSTVAIGAAGVVYFSDNETVVTNIIDGDTIDVSQSGTTKRVRLLNIDTPEIGKECLAEEAREFLAGLLPVGSTVTLELDQVEFDKYGRTLAGVYKDDVLVNEIIAREGFGSVMTIAPNTKFLSQVSAAAEHAKYADKGIYGVGPKCFVVDDSQWEEYDNAKQTITSGDTFASHDQIDLDAANRERKKLLLALSVLNSLKKNGFSQTAYQRSLYGDRIQNDLDSTISQGENKIETLTSQVEKEEKRLEKEKLERELKLKLEQENALQRAQQENSTPSQDQNQNYQAPAPPVSAPSLGTRTENYTGCRAYGGNYALTSVDAKGRPYAKIDCSTKAQIG